MLLFQSPYGDFGTLTSNRIIYKIFDYQFQSPYGDFGTLTRANAKHL